MDNKAFLIVMKFHIFPDKYVANVHTQLLIPFQT